MSGRSSPERTAPTLAALPEPQRAAALARFTVLRPHLEDGVPLTHVAEAAGVPLRTVQRWLAATARPGWSGLPASPALTRAAGGCRTTW